MLTLFFNRGLLQLFSHLSSPPLIFCNLDPFRYYTGTCFINRLVIHSVISSGWTFRFSGDRQQLPRDFRQRKLVSMCYTICRFPPVDCYVETEERNRVFGWTEPRVWSAAVHSSRIEPKEIEKGAGLAISSTLLWAVVLWAPSLPIPTKQTYLPCLLNYCHCIHQNAWCDERGV